ncbi:MAG: hypothetical protein KDD47_09705, partial [Acidobacteria bacterium]|nr:hypothetical protein [Acidobacteriota bacterium]
MLHRDTPDLLAKVAYHYNQSTTRSVALWSEKAGENFAGTGKRSASIPAGDKRCLLLAIGMERDEVWLKVGPEGVVHWSKLIDAVNPEDFGSMRLGTNVSVTVELIADGIQERLTVDLEFIPGGRTYGAAALARLKPPPFRPLADPPSPTE